ncbi:MAG: hypothetical protein KatS3mg105_2132 [Gemmatales bacterium]|nr:MAG: hypothetical protein KatS3mg105_2132 [Gemmatales bacterium]
MRARSAASNQGRNRSADAPIFLATRQPSTECLKHTPTFSITTSRPFPDFTAQVRGRADYQRSLDLLARVKQRAPEIVTKSGLMLGLGETVEEVFDVLADLRQVGCDNP